MARVLTKTASPNQQYFSRADLSGISDYPFSVSAWVYVTDDTHLHWVWGLEASDASGPTQSVRVVPDNVSGLAWNGVSVLSQTGIGGTAESECQVQFSVPLNTWMHITAVFESDTNRRGEVYIPSTGQTFTGQNTDTRNFDGVSMDRTLVGYQLRQSPDWDMDGGFKHIAVYSDVLTATEILQLQAFVPGDQVNTANLLAFYEAEEVTTGANLIDSSGNSRTLTANGSPTHTTDRPQIVVYDSGADATNKTTKAAAFLDYANFTDLAVGAGQSVSYAATVTHTDNNGGSSAESALSTAWGIELVEDSGVDTTNKTNYTSGTLAADGYFATVVHRDAGGLDSAESTPDAFTISAEVSASIVAATEADSAPAIVDASPVVASIAAASESNAGVLVIDASPVVGTLTPATETNTAPAVVDASPVVQSIVTATETDSALGVVDASPIVASISAATETDAGVAVVDASPVLASIVAASEIDQSVQVAGGAIILASITAATETDLLPLVIPGGMTGVTFTTNSAGLPADSIFFGVTGIEVGDGYYHSTVTDPSSLAVSGDGEGVLTINGVTQTETVYAFVHDVSDNSASNTMTVTIEPPVAVSGTIAPAQEIDAGAAVVDGSPVVASIAAASEADSAPAVADGTQVIASISPAQETDAGVVVINASAVTALIEAAQETDSAVVVVDASPVSASISPASESGAAVAVLDGSIVIQSINPSAETDTAQTVLAMDGTVTLSSLQLQLNSIEAKIDALTSTLTTANIADAVWAHIMTDVNGTPRSMESMHFLTQFYAQEAFFSAPPADVFAVLQQAVLKNTNLLEADEIHTPTEIIKKQRGTETELLRKNVTGSNLDGTITVTDP